MDVVHDAQCFVERTYCDCAPVGMISYDGCIEYELPREFPESGT